MNNTVFESSLGFDDARNANMLFGPQNRHLHILSKLANVQIGSRGTSVTLRGKQDDVEVLERILWQLYAIIRQGGLVTEDDVQSAYRMIVSEPDIDLKTVFGKATYIASSKKYVTPKTINQQNYIEALQEFSLTIGVGPAGTGKTYLAVAIALSMLLNKKVKRLVLTRPAVEAGEKLGFLPGDLAQKINPYLRPLFDALHDMLDFERVQEMMEMGIIEIAPLAFMRGRTLNDSFIILDEAQNTTVEQMKMFLTRLGFGSRMAITGDVTQIDLPGGHDRVHSGLVHALKVLDGVEGIRTVHFEEKDVIRHPLVGRIVHAYESFKKYS